MTAKKSMNLRDSVTGTAYVHESEGISWNLRDSVIQYIETYVTANDSLGLYVTVKDCLGT